MADEFSESERLQMDPEYRRQAHERRDHLPATGHGQAPEPIVELTDEAVREHAILLVGPSKFAGMDEGQRDGALLASRILLANALPYLRVKP